MSACTVSNIIPAADSEPVCVLHGAQGGIDLLVELLVSGDAYTSEAARYCLMSLRRGNTKNQAEVIAAIRANGNVVRNVRCAGRA